MLEEVEFRKLTETALSSLLQHLIRREEADDSNFEVEEQGGVLNVVFEEPPGKFVITPNAPVRQIWISALSTSFKLDWDSAANDFVLPSSRQTITQLIQDAIGQQLGEEVSL